MLLGFEWLFGGLGVAAVSALWNIAGGLGRFEARTTQILEDHQDLLRDHEERIRGLETDPSTCSLLTRPVKIRNLLDRP